MRWNNTIDIVEALEESYPDEDLYSLGTSEILDLVIELPEFDDIPDDAAPENLKTILFRWRELREENGGE